MTALPQKDSIEIIHSSKLDKSLWDHCAAQAEGLIYSYSWYLDAMAKDWYGLVVGNYDTVMALPVKRKFGITIIAMPAFIQRLDIIGRQTESFERIEKAIMKLSNIVQYASSQNELFARSAFRKRTNFILHLDKDHASIFDNYTSSCRKNISKADNRGCQLAYDISINDVISLYRKAYGNVAAYTEEHFMRLKNLINTLHADHYHLAGVRDDKGEIVFAGLLLDDGKRLYYLLGAPTQKGRQMRATYFFIDSMIKRFAESGKIFDFEGSDIPDVARFYQSFSPDMEDYYQHYVNRFPFPLNKIIDAKLKPF